MILFCAKCEEPYEAADEKTPCPDCGSEGVAAPPVESALLIRFVSADSASFDIQPVGTVTAGQMAVAGEWLLTRARDMWGMAFAEMVAEQRARAAQAGVLVPGMAPGVAAQVMRDVKGGR